MEQQTKVISAFVGVFIAGAVFGGLFTFGTASRQAAASVAATPPPQSATPQAKGPVERPLPAARIDPKMMREYTRRLTLTDEQRTLIKPYMARAEEELQRLRRQNLQDTTRTMNRMYDDIARNLTPEQLVELEKMKRALRERMAEESKKDRAEELKTMKKTEPQAQPLPVKPAS